MLVLYRLELLGPENVGFVSTVMDWTKERRFIIDWNSWGRRKSVLYQLEWIVPDNVGFALTGMAWTAESGFCID